VIGEFDLYGVFLSPVLISALIALAVGVVVRRLLALVGLYRFVWHPALFDAALFVIVWAITAAFPLPRLA
jgi:protein AaeX